MHRKNILEKLSSQINVWSFQNATRHKNMIHDNRDEPKTDKNLKESDTNKRKRPTFTESGLLLKQKRTLYDSYENLFIISTISAIAIFAAVLCSEFSR